MTGHQKLKLSINITKIILIFVLIFGNILHGFLLGIFLFIQLYIDNTLKSKDNKETDNDCKTDSKSTKIKTLDEAREYYVSFGCSSFHMAREDMYDEAGYKKMNISRELELQWRKEEIDKGLSAIKFVNVEELSTYVFHLSGLMHNTDGYGINNLYHFLEREINLESVLYKTGILSCIIGTNSSLTRGGLIEKAYIIKDYELVSNLINLALKIIYVCENQNERIAFARGELCDIINAYNVAISEEIINKLIMKNDLENFAYYNEGVGEENLFSVKKLAEFYYKGKGCTEDKKQARELLVNHHLLSDSATDLELEKFFYN